MKGKGAKSKGAKSKATVKKKTTSSKIGNKTNSKLAKRGKLKKGKKKKNERENDRKMRSIPRSESVSYKRSRDVDSAGEDIHEDDMQVDSKDYKYFTTPGRNFSFLSDIENRLGDTADSKKRKRKTFEDKKTVDYEQTPRKYFAGLNEHGVRHLLPIKEKGKVIRQIVPKTEKIEQEEVVEEETIQDEIPQLPPMSNVELFLLRRKTLSEMKEKIANYASAILANPEDNLNKMKDLRIMLTSSEISSTVHKLILVSLMEIFKDTIPGYRIRVITDTEKEHQVKKDTKQLLEYETQFLANYKHYIEHLQNAVRRFKTSKCKHLKELPDICKQSLFEVSVKCLASLLARHPHFNYRKDLIQAVIPFMNHSKSELSTHVCQAVETVFKNDTLGESTLEIVKAIGKFIKSKDFTNLQPKVLKTYLSLRITDIDKLIAETTPKQTKKKSEDMSRKERRRKKKMRVLENELLETKATEDKSKRLKLHTETLESVFHTYFRILKSASQSPLLPCVLEGLAKFAHLINIQFFNDLFAVLNQLINSGDLAYREILHCVQSAFTILSGQGSALNVDPLTFYKHLYSRLFEVHAGSSSNDVSIILPCLYILIMKQKRKLSQQKVLAFMKRLSTVAMQQLPQGALSLLAAVKQFIHAYSCSDLLFDGESQGSGIFFPELEEPEYCNAHNTVLWEFQLLRRHYDQDVRAFSQHLCHQAPTTGNGLLPTELRKNPEELFSRESVIFDDQVPSKIKHIKQRRYSRKGFVGEGMKMYIDNMSNKVPDITHFDKLV